MVVTYEVLELPCLVAIISCEYAIAKKQTSISQWLVSGATPPLKKAEVDSNTEDRHSLPELVSHSQTPPTRSTGVCLNQVVSQSDLRGTEAVYGLQVAKQMSVAKKVLQ